MSLFFEKPKEKIGHRYDVLVMIDKENDAILENINHEDIAFFRKTEITEKDQKIAWIFNNTPIVLEKRSEVKFFDKHELLKDGSLKSEKDKEVKQFKSLNDGKVRRNSMLFDKIPMQIGMIIRVRLKDEKAAKDNRPYSGEFNSYSETPLASKRPSKTCPSDHVISKFVIDNGQKERLNKESLSKYRLESPRAQLSPRTSQDLGSVSIDMDQKALNKSAVERARAKSDCSSDSDFSIQSSEYKHKFKDASFRSEHKEQSDDESLPYDFDGPSRKYNFDEVYDDEVKSIGSSDKYEYEDEDELKKEESWKFATKKREESWKFPSEKGYNNNEESASHRRGSWRKVDENLNPRVKRSHGKLEDDDSS
jgi:hypothetical protein